MITQEFIKDEVITPLMRCNEQAHAYIRAVTESLPKANTEFLAELSQRLDEQLAEVNRRHEVADLEKLLAHS